MERLEYDHYGGPGVVRVRAFELLEPLADELLVRVAAASINPVDWKIRSGAMKIITGWNFPRAMGTDFAGIVEAVGANISDLEPGDAVLGTVPLKRSGAFATKLVTTRSLVVKKPESLSFSAAASLPVAGVTAWQVPVKSARLHRGQRLFINGASGAVGQAAIKIGRAIGADAVGRVGPQSLAHAQDLGLSLVLNYTEPIPEVLNGSFDLVFDANGSLSIKEGDHLIKRGGLVIDIAPTPRKFLSALLSRSRKFVFADVKRENLQQVVDLAAAGKLTIPVASTISLAEAPAVLASLEQGNRLSGKAVIAF